MINFDGPDDAAFPHLTEGESVPTWHNLGTDDVGIDRLSISFPIRSREHWSRWEQVSYSPASGRQTASARLPVMSRDGNFIAPCKATVKGPMIMVGVTKVVDQEWAKIECNPSRFADPEGCSLMSPRLLPAALSVMWLRAQELVEPACQLAGANVTRVDVARDFRGITSPALYVHGLGPIRRPWARRSFTYNDPGRSQAETLFVGSGAGGVRLYDQHQAYAAKGAPEGSLRWEAEARKGWLQACDVRHTADLDVVSIARLTAERWAWSAMGTPVTGPVHAVDVLRREVAAGHIKRAVAHRLLGSAVDHAMGGAGQSRRSEYRYRKIAGELGVGSDALWSDRKVARVTARLDFASGTEVLESASPKS